MNPIERQLINASSSGSLVDMSLTEIRALIEKLAIKSKHSANEEELYLDQLIGVRRPVMPTLTPITQNSQKLFFYLQTKKRC